ncbi:MAG: HD domain-containing protein [Candidatus Eisenbacteria bacterium]|nr:HD domain-containing protein [Candidatus Eisenbacteria bacterium]
MVKLQSHTVEEEAAMNHKPSDSPSEAAAAFTGDPAELIPIPMESLRIDTVTEFDLMLKAPGSGKFVLYRRGDLVFSEEHKEKLQQSNVSAVYISTKDRPRYLRYLERNLGEIIDDPRLGPVEKARIVYECSGHVAQEIMDSPWVAESLRRANGIVGTTVTHLLRSPANAGRMIEMMASDYQLYSHSVNVCVYGVTLGQGIGLSVWELRELGAGLLLHDLGKTELDPKLVKKTEPLTADEQRIMRRHPELGVAKLKQLPGVKENALKVVGEHHERLTGHGFPKGLKGEEIHLFARIGFLANAFDRMTTDRRAGGPLTSYSALRAIQEALGEEVEPPLLRHFVTLLGKRSDGDVAQGGEDAAAA